MAVAGIVMPVAILVEVVVTDDVVREILGGAGMVVALIAAVGPTVELVGAADVLDIGVPGLRRRERWRRC